MTDFIKFLALLAIALIIAALLLFVVNVKSNAVLQPIPFNHNLHVDGQGLECTFCHKQVMKNARAELPGIEICRECHEEKMTETEVEKELLDFISGNREIPWQRIYQVPDHVYFSHRRHTVSGKIGCESCHGNVTALKEPPKYPLVPITMDHCMECHEERNITNDCLSCHR